MQVANDTVVTLDYVLTDDQGNVLDKSEGGQFAYLHGASNIIPGLEAALTNRDAGETLEVRVAPEDAYGPRNESMVQVVPRAMFEGVDEIEVGQQFHAQAGDGQTVTVTVAAVDGDDITIDGNHPLAGTRLNFEIDIVDVRDATAEELSHGHVHATAEA